MSLYDPATAPEIGGKEPLDLVHFALFGRNAGDKLLPVMVRDVIAAGFERSVRWTARHVHGPVDEKRLDLINRSDGVVIGGGGLFLHDTNANNVSGWQWPCSIEAMQKIQVPFALFAVGYNRFRDQADFGPRFKENLEQLTEQSVFIGLRNTGSISAIRSYLPERLHSKVRYQPCPTTLATLMYPRLLAVASTAAATRPVSLNCAFDRADLRFGADQRKVLDRLATAMQIIARDHPIEYLAHLKGDEAFLPYLEARGVSYTLRRLYRSSPAEIVAAYARPSVALGMRGHAQMIPFGCGRSVLSLASHDKLWYFLRDTGLEGLGVEMADPNLVHVLPSKVNQIIGEAPRVEERIEQARDHLWEVSQANIADLRRAIVA